MRELRYGHTIMNPEPQEMSLDELAARLKSQEAVRITLAPGDATIYKLILLVANGVLCVTKLDGREEPHSIYYMPWRWDSQKAYLVGGNEWTQKLLGWWLEGVSAKTFNH